jgi:hypothetical protein
MPSLSKKKSKAAAALQVPSWHPNFRNYEKLPDIKVVRTAFFVNGAGIFIALALALYFGVQEWQLHGLRVEIADWRRQLERDQPGSDQAVALFKRFQGEAAKLAEVDSFVKSKPFVSEIMLRIGQTMPENIALDSFTLTDAGLLLRLTVRGTPDAAASYATAYLEQLKADPELTRFEEPKTNSVSRNPGTGRLAVEVLLPLKGYKKS